MRIRFALASSLVISGLALASCGAKDGKAQIKTSVKQVTPKIHPDVLGEYYFGDGLGVNCSLEIKSGQKFEFSWHGCMGEYDRNSGTHDWEGELLVIHPTKLNKRSGFRGTPTRFYPVAWGDRFYLVADEQMLEFCYSYSKGWRGKEFLGRSSDFYLRIDKSVVSKSLQKDLKSPPAVPKMFESVLRYGFQAKVLKSLDKKTVLIDKGADDGVAIRTMLVTKDGEWLNVIKLSPHGATCELWDRDGKLPTNNSTLSPVKHIF